MTKILFITHNATRTGAPLLLLWLIQWLTEYSDIDAYILCAEGGELESEFNRIAVPVYLIKHDSFPIPWHKRRIASLFRKARSNTEVKADHQLGILSDSTGIVKPVTTNYWDIIYANTLVLGGIIRKMGKLSCPLISHAHELQIIIDQMGSEVSHQISSSSAIICASNAVKANLLENHAQSLRCKLYTIYEYLPHDRINYLGGRSNIPDKDYPFQFNTYNIIAVGSCDDPRKGLDIFVQLIHCLSISFPALPIRALWVGGNLKSAFPLRILADIKKLGITDKIHVLGNVEDSLRYIAQADVFVLTSREDPFPVSCLEAAALSKPIICFDKAGGMPEFTKDGCGFSVPYLDVYEMAKTIAGLYAEPTLAREAASKAYAKLIQDLTVDTAGTKILDIINRLSTSSEGN